jgi:DnaJ-class molecular chaperone
LKIVKRWICSACSGVYFVEHAEARGKCPGCGGQGEPKDVEMDEAGVVHVNRPYKAPDVQPDQR